MAAAAGWSNCDDVDELNVPEVLVGLLAEPECRAALFLAAAGIDTSAVVRHFSLAEMPASPSGRAARFSTAWLDCLHTAETLLAEYPRPLTLATEHLLLGIAASAGPVADWLALRGLTAIDLEAEIHRLSGFQPGPLPLDDADVAPLDTAPLDTAPLDTAPLDTAPLDTVPDAGQPTRDALAALRVVDAASNRASEGLRVIEDYLRFGLDDRHLTAECKSLRHELAAVLALFPAVERAAARETRRDVGVGVSLPSEQSRLELAAVAGASFNRVEQALRSLEEFSKLLTDEAARRFEQLRYRVYTLERAAEITRDSVARLAAARLYVLTDGCPTLAAFRQRVAALVAAGVHVVQLRDKSLVDRHLLERARLLVELTAGTPTLSIINDRPDLATLSGADGVHVGQNELSVKDARSIVGSRALIGVSAHSLAQARAAVLDGANYIGVGPTFPSGTKQFAEFTGTELLTAVAAEIRLPAFAIGGVTPANVSQVLSTGVKRIAVSGAVTSAADPAAAAAALLQTLARSG